MWQSSTVNFQNSICGWFFFIKSCFEILSTMPKITVRILQNQCLGYGYLFKEESMLNSIKIQFFARWKYGVAWSSMMHICFIIYINKWLNKLMNHEVSWKNTLLWLQSFIKFYLKTKWWGSWFFGNKGKLNFYNKICSKITLSLKLIRDLNSLYFCF